MTDRDARFLSLYRSYRHEDQQTFYVNRAAEYEGAHEQTVTLTALLMAASTIVGALAAGDVGEMRGFWSVLAVAFPTLSSALAAYDRLYAFDQQAKLYRDAALSLIRARADAPDIGPEPVGGVEYDRALSAYVNEVEGVFHREQGQWGQLISDLQPAATEPEQPQPKE